MVRINPGIRSTAPARRRNRSSKASLKSGWTGMRFMTTYTPCTSSRLDFPIFGSRPGESCLQGAPEGRPLPPAAAGPDDPQAGRGLAAGELQRGLNADPVGGGRVQGV